ncbi:TRAP transporter large permease [Sulfitobacter pseudonitzschiae]|uniref:TRAP transporter large permease protein n=1 Tax=Pseudosulfitobacter pseudonitzschiae TaxID=1402135 RepID=A0A9Q2RX49_9RHOB|nr:MULTISPECIES: TRAP transporter large permease [Roseobacteraceae]MBM2292130.1 TRAP transporter large permease [Pseudosulfitobacter pseudonitzschiae]MBM2297048.1 TRAP transporter large permease [Pseudosulfitobacter pseudonitzschiae]MBM2301962.1 TRAP transporter large permease [Pseudosulfitobacter pseudonitzschiae]MBM2311744.1 TRAP transporter large permease [Pseudosulfitobacter pseudonitzschiae]MBM2316658.1 TRAP transporter large permease [Pseudosulfitobacter pseudonitzschiae]|tara:strand:+ start:265 stop:1575 length:1311 start_codon:yes stop_codon:yes gene_type:complete
MSELQIAGLFIGALFFLILMRIPIGVSLIAVSFAGLWSMFNWNIAWGSLGIVPYNFANSWVLSSIPAFLLMGFICYHTKLTQGLFSAAQIWLSGLPGGLAIASVFGCAGFAAVTGSSVACSAAMGKIAVPEMIRHRYSAELATGTVAAAGTIGALIPPSILMILYGIISRQSVSQLFLGGLVVGVITLIAYVLLIVVRVKLNPDLAPPVHTQATRAEKIRALGQTWPVLLIVIGVFAGLFGGVFTPTEAGAIGATLSTLVALVYRTLTLKALRMAIVETITTTAALLIIAVGASLLTRFLALSGIGDALSSSILSFGVSPVLIMVGIVVVYLLLGMMLEPVGAMLLTLPVVLPLVDETGFSLLWFGVVLVKLLEIGMITPPMGMNVFVIKGVVGNIASLSTIFKGVFWFVIVDLLIVAALIAYPDIVLFLPQMFAR